MCSIPCTHWDFTMMDTASSHKKVLVIFKECQGPVNFLKWDLLAKGKHKLGWVGRCGTKDHATVYFK